MVVASILKKREREKEADRVVKTDLTLRGGKRQEGEGKLWEKLGQATIFSPARSSLCTRSSPCRVPPDLADLPVSAKYKTVSFFLHPPLLFLRASE